MATVTMNPSTLGRTDIAGLLQQLTGEREQKYQAGLETLQRVADLMAGPEFDKYAQSMYETAKKETVGAGMQNLISSGLMGTERAMQPGMQFEREVGTPFRLGLAEQKAGRIAGALGRVADYMQAGTPDAGTLSYLATGGFGALSPQEQMAMQQFPYLMQAAQQREQAGIGLDASQGAGGGGGYMPSYSNLADGGDTGGGGVAGGGTTGLGNIYGTGVIPGTTGVIPGTTGGGTTKPYQSGGAYTWEPEGVAEPTVEPMFAGGAGGQFGGTGAGGSWEESTTGEPKIGDTKQIMINGQPTTCKWSGAMWVRTGQVGT